MSSIRFAVLGHPVAHSLSPRIHQAFARDTGIELDYRAIDATAEEFKTILDAFAHSGGAGANITLPLKEIAFSHCAVLTDRARRAGAVNTLMRHGERWDGDNTDGVGLVRDLTERHRIDIRGRRCLMLGAGGAARGVAPALLDAGVESMVIVNRNPERADRLIDLLGDPGHVSSRYWEDLRSVGDFELIVNATSAGRADAKLALPFSLAHSRFDAVDLSYGEAAIGFLAWARAAKAEHALDGLGMLVEQAAESFEMWHGKRPDTDPVYAALRSESRALHTGD